MYKQMVVFANTFHSSKTGKDYTRLFVPVGSEVVGVICEGDKTGLIGTEVEFSLTCKNGVLQLFYNERF